MLLRQLHGARGVAAGCGRHRRGGSDTNYSLVSLWEPLVEHPHWPTFTVAENRVVKLQLDSVSCVHVYSMSLDRKTCLVYDA